MAGRTACGQEIAVSLLLVLLLFVKATISGEKTKIIIPKLKRSFLSPWMLAMDASSG